MPNTIKSKRGALASLPSLAYGEIAICYDVSRVFMGNSTSNNDSNRKNIEIITDDRIKDFYAMNQISVDKIANTFNTKYPDKVSYFNAAGKLTASTVTIEELNKLKGITINIQDELDKKVEGGKGIKIVIAPNNPGGTTGKRTIWYKK